MLFRTLAFVTTLTLGSLTAMAAQPGADEVIQILKQTEGSRDQRADQLKDLLKDAPSNAEPLIALYLAEQYRLLGETRLAKKHYRAVSRSTSPLSRGGDLGLVLLDGINGLDESGRALLRSVSEADLPDSLNAERHLLLASLAAKGDQPQAAGEHSRAALAFAASDPDVDRYIRRLLRGLIDGELPTAKPTGGDPTAALERALQEGDATKVSMLAATLLESAEPDSDLALYARYAEQRLQGATLQPRLIGVLLPLSGKYRGVGNQVKTALERGVDAGGDQVKLVFADTGEGAGQEVKALEDLVLKQGVAAVVGPLRSELAEPVARTAQALRVPMIGLHQDNNAAKERDWVADGLATPRAQIRALLDYTMTERGLRRFAIFAPDTPYGQGAAEVFVEEVQARGGEIKVREHYAPDEADLIPYAQKLGRKDYQARAAEFRQVKRDIQERGGDPGRAVLPPVVDFDAIFLPDGHRRIPVAAAGLAYEEFSIGQFKVDKDTAPIPLLGLSGWNHPELVTTGGPYVRDSIFVDVWLPDAPETLTFIADYESQTRRRPNSLEAQAFTVGRVVAGLSRTQASTRAEVLEALRTLDGEPTATGARRISLDEDRVDHLLQILTLDRDGIRQLERVQVPPPE